jgi:hypothetical protein
MRNLYQNAIHQSEIVAGVIVLIYHNDQDRWQRIRPNAKKVWLSWKKSIDDRNCERYQF